jgi:hypothetical protein
MKSDLYFFLARILIKFTYWFKILSIKSNMYRQICEIRAVYYSKMSHDQKIEMMQSVK